MISKTEAQDWVASAMEIANDGNWSELIASGLDNDGLEMLRQLRSMNRDIERLEEAESKMHQALVNRVMVSMAWDDDDSSEPEPATPDPSVVGASPRLTPTAPTADPLADLFIQRRTA